MKVVKLTRRGYVSAGGDDTTVMYPKQEQSDSMVNRAPFWAVLERTAALAEPEDRVQPPELVELVGDVSAVGPGDTRHVESDSQRPREVFAHIRELLGDVEGSDEAELGSSPGQDERGAQQEMVAARDGDDDGKIDSSQSGVARDGSHGDIQDVARDQSPGGAEGMTVQPTAGLLFEAVPAAPLADDAQSTTGPSEGVLDVEPELSSGGTGPMYEFGAHTTVIPGTEEFMDSLARKNLAFEHTGEIDTDLDRAADKLGWNRTDDDLIVKRKLFKKKKK